MSINHVGDRCAAVRRFQHRFAGEPPSELGPLEFRWDDGSFTTLDANADWTLSVSTNPWSDPFAHVGAAERRRLAHEVGLWEPVEPQASLRQVVGQRVAAVEPFLNDVGELTSIRLVFPDAAVTARVVGGNLVVDVQDQ